MVILPFVPSVPYYEFTTTLESSVVKFRVRWNERDAAWYFDCELDDGTVLRQGVKVVLGTYLGRACNTSIFAQGAIVAHDMTKQARDAGYDDIGERVQVRYYTALELQALQDGQLVPS